MAHHHHKVSPMNDVQKLLFAASIILNCAQFLAWIRAWNTVADLRKQNEDHDNMA